MVGLRSNCFSVSSRSSSTAFPFPLSSLGEFSPLLFRAISILTLLGSETLFVALELPLLSTCRLALVDPECRFCLCSGSVKSGYSPPAAAPSRGELRSGCCSGMAMTLSSLCCLRRVDDGPRGVELLGFQRRAALGRRGRPRAMLLPPVPERLRNGDAKVLLKSGFPPPIRALRRLQRVGLVTRTWG